MFRDISEGRGHLDRRARQCRGRWARVPGGGRCVKGSKGRDGLPESLQGSRDPKPTPGSAVPSGDEVPDRQPPASWPSFPRFRKVLKCVN